jgi:sulfate adenylyltransferase subunit 2
MLYSIGKDSAVMLRLALKAFHPAPLPFPLLHIDTTWKFRAMIEFRDRFTRELGLDLRVHTNPRDSRRGSTPSSTVARGTPS